MPRIAAVVLAAGESKRFGFPKQLIVREGEPLVRRIARAAVEAGADPVIVVLGANAKLVAPELSGLPSVTTVVNRDWSRGLSSSLLTGLTAAFSDPSCEAALVTLADQPLVDAAALRRLMAAFNARQRIVASAYDDTVGVPAIFGREHADDLMRLTGDAGAGSWLRSRRSGVTSVSLQAGAVDIDTSADLARLV
ncbi:MAG TPA: nucleotidyltransferase family protein [Gemmatimonadaceae bacterium]|nr:nucleotidyltransferase family protein [Gemmatimonadaceae bacterium]